MQTYYEIKGTIDGQTEVLDGSFDKTDMTYNLETEREGWKNEGFKKLHITTRQTEDTPDPEVYGRDFKHVTAENAAELEETEEKFICILEMLEASANDTGIEDRVNELQDKLEALTEANA
jgi:hypothetical protein